MRNYELLMAVYDRCPNPANRQYTVDQYLDRCLDIREMIERERPELKDGESEYPQQQEAGIDY
jgi:hypothetical protein